MSQLRRGFFCMKRAGKDEGGESEVSTGSGSDRVAINATVEISRRLPGRYRSRY